MYIYDLEYTENEARLYGQSTAPKYMAAYSKTWEEVYLSQILSEITDSYQLNGIDDVWYKYKPCNTKLISFMNTMAELEGAVLIQYNDKVMLVNEQALEAQTPLFQVNCAGASIRINDETEELFDACVVQSGGFFGSYRISDGSNVYKPNITVPCASDAEAFRYARALLRYANKGKTMVRWQGTLIPELSARVCIDLVNEDIPSWAGTMFCYRVRHDYGKGQTTIFMRRPLEGY